VKTIARLASVLGLVLALSACTPQYWIDTVFATDSPAATRVAQCESGMNPAAVSPTNDHGLFQINAIHKAEFSQVTGQPWASIYSAEWNTKFAKWMYDRQGWYPWSCRP
jgi:hypothetical protein